MSQSYRFPLKKRFAKTLLVEFEEWYLEALGGQWWKGKHLLFKTGKQLSDKLHSVLLIRLSELQLSPQEIFAKTVLFEFEMWYLEAHRGQWWKRKYLQLNWKVAFGETALCSVNSCRRVTAFPSISLSLTLFLWNLKSDIWKPIKVNAEKGNI